MANNRCCICNKDGATTCSTCNSASYCSENCMKDDERTHNLLCASFGAFNKTRPTKTAVLALYFPIITYGEKGLSAPKIVWVDTQHEMHIVERKTDGSIEYTDPLRHDAFEIRFSQPRDLLTPVEARGFEINQNYSKKFQLLYPVVLHMWNAFNFDGSRPNLTLIEVSREQLSHKWKGPLILYSKKTFFSSCACRDVTLSDFRTLLDFCKVYGASEGGLRASLLANNFTEVKLTNPSLFATMLLHCSGDRTLQGVEIACKGDKEFLKTNQFMSVAVPVAHPIFDDINYDNGLIAGFGATEVSKMIELPLLVRRIFPHKRWNRKREMRPTMYSNPIAIYLKLETDIQSARWGFPDLGFPDGHIYSRVLVVRKDQLAITALQVEVVCAYFKKVSEVLYTEKNVRLLGLLGGHLCKGRAKLMAEHVSRSKFEDFFKEFKEQKVKGGDVSWRDEISPYEVVAEESDDDDLGSEMDALELGSDSERVKFEWELERGQIS